MIIGEVGNRVIRILSQVSFISMKDGNFFFGLIVLLSYEEFLIIMLSVFWKNVASFF